MDDGPLTSTQALRVGALVGPVGAPALTKSLLRRLRFLVWLNAAVHNIRYRP